MTGAVHTIQTADALIVCADGHVAYTKCTCTTLSFLLDHFLGLLDCLSCCHYGGHLAAAVLLCTGCQRGCRMMMMGLSRGEWGMSDKLRSMILVELRQSVVSVELLLCMCRYLFYRTRFGCPSVSALFLL
jgi:hypothetical protein